jgi:maltooligosyltrehalose trehalohydrolase
MGLVPLVFRVWAPAVSSVDLVVDDRSEPMAPTEGGWWEVAVVDAAHGTRYGYSLDGGPVRPDPRSPSQPDGVHGRSQLLDHRRFEWACPVWRGLYLPGSVLYELHVGTFTPAGTFEAVADRLDHLVSLGVDAVELMPVVEFPGRRGWGYDGVDLFAPHHAYGGPEGLKRLIDACHQARIGVVMDVVYNHLGPSGNYLPEFGPYFTARHRTNWGDAVNFDGPGSDEVRRFVIDNATMWLRDYRCDGLRLDAVHAIVDNSAVHILEELASEVEALSREVRRPLFLIAEDNRNDPRIVRSRAAGGYGIDAVWADDWHHAVHAAITGERAGYYDDFGSLQSVAKAARQAWVYDGLRSKYRQRRYGRSPSGLSGHSFVVSVQNHDQVGNRPQGERIGMLVGAGRAKIAAALMLTGPFIPMLFQGEEWGATSPFEYFTNHDDPELGKAVRDGRRRELASFQWAGEEVPNPQDPSTYERSKLDWTEVGKDAHQEMLSWYRTLIALRRQRPELSDPRWERIEATVSEDERWLVLQRGTLGIAVSLAAGDIVVPLPSPARVVVSSDPSVASGGHGLLMPPDSVAVFERRDHTAGY